MERTQVDREKLCVFVRSLSEDLLFIVVDRALRLVPEEHLSELLDRIPRPDLTPDGGLLEQLRTFEERSEANEYYDAFDVNWKNSNQVSRGTRSWLAEWERLAGKVPEVVKRGEYGQAAEAFRILRRLASEAFVDARHIFIADELGWWNLHANWKEVLPAWFESLARTAPSDEFAEAVVSAIHDIVPDERRWFLEKAQGVATPAQVEALAARA